MVYHGAVDRLEFDFVIQPGADSSKIELSHAGVATQAVADSGALVLSLAGGGEIRLLQPMAYQIESGERCEIAATYRLTSSGRVQFSVGVYDHGLPLIIDPVLTYLRYLEASSANEDVVIDSFRSSVSDSRSRHEERIRRRRAPLCQAMENGRQPERENRQISVGQVKL